MEHKIIIGSIALCALTLFVIFGAILYAIFSIGARSEPKEDYYLIIHKEKHPRSKKDE